MKNRSRIAAGVSTAIIFLLFALNVFGQAGTVTGVVTDPSGATVPGADVSIVGKGVTQRVKTDSNGSYKIVNLPAGQYDILVSAKGFASYSTQGLNVTGGSLSFDVPLVVAAEAASVTVSTDSNRVTTDPSQNVGAIVLKAEDLKMLSDDPDDLANDLQALAGPAAGPNGGQIFIDGFSGGRLPPKESIREIRINSNPFSAEYDRMGFGRIEVFTKPGTDKFRGQAFFNYGNKVFNTRNPFVVGNVPDFQQEMFGGSLSGPISKRSSFFIDVNRRNIDENALVVATTLDSSNNIVPFNASIVTPLRRTDINPRIDYAINPNNTLVLRYMYGTNTSGNQGVSGFTLPSNATNSSRTDHTVQLTETAVIGSRMINEVRFQFITASNNSAAVSTDVLGRPTIVVQSAFTGGSPSQTTGYTDEKDFELQNNVSITHGAHQIKVGGRGRRTNQDNFSNGNYNGTFVFGGRGELTSLQVYQMAQQLLASGSTPAQVAALGYGPSQFSRTGGIPLTGVSQWDLGVYVQDDWRVKPNMTLSLGGRYETQNNIGDHGDFAPRIGISWAPGAKKGAQPKTVIRTGFGIFYDRVDDGLTLAALRQNGVVQQQFVLRNPDFYPNVPTVDSLVTAKLPQAIRSLDNTIKAPRIDQAVFGVERQLPLRMALTVNYVFSRGTHQLRSRNINAPLPGSYDINTPGSGVRPYGAAVGDLYQYESSGSFRQNQLIFQLNARVSPKLTIFSFYTYGHAYGDTDGAGNFPANQYDTSTEWSRTRFDVRNRAFIGGSLTAPWKLSFSPMIILSSGAPYNVTSGNDLNGDGQFTDRPALATDLTRASVVKTAFGNFDTRPLPGTQIIQRNLLEGPGTISVNMRVSRSWGFGERKTAQAAGAGGGFDGGGGPRGGGGGPRGGGGGMPMGGMGGMRGGGGPGMFGGGTAGNNRFVLTASANVRNAINYVNLGTPVGDLSSPIFGKSQGIGGGFGPGGGGGAAGNRRVEFSLRLSF